MAARQTYAETKTNEGILQFLMKQIKTIAATTKLHANGCIHKTLKSFQKLIFQNILHPFERQLFIQPPDTSIPTRLQAYQMEWVKINNQRLYYLTKWSVFQQNHHTEQPF
jgi:hypothetical protein